MFKQIFILVLFLLQGFYNNCFPQVNVEWFRTYSGGYGRNLVNDFAMDSLGNSYLTGEVSRDATNSRWAAGTVKFNSNGELLWSKIFEGANNQIHSKGNAIVLNTDGDVFITGTCLDSSGINFRTWKYNSDGNLIWSKYYDSDPRNGIDVATDITLDRINNIYITGFSISPSPTYYYSWSTLKYDSSGQLKWVKRYNGDSSKPIVSQSIITDDNQNVYVCGYVEGSSNSIDFCTIKYDSSGNEIWSSIFDNANLLDKPVDLILDNTGNLYVLGQSFIHNNAFYTTLVKYDENGNLIWHASTDSLGANVSYHSNRISLKLDSQNNICIATTYQYNCCTIKYDSSGNQLWISKFNSPNYEYCIGLGINIDKFDNIYTTGHSRIYNSNLEPFVTIKYNSNGTMLWNRAFHVYNDTEFDEGAFIGLDKNYNVYIAGNHTDNNNFIKYSLLKYSQSVGINTLSTEIPNNFQLHQNYPNPFNPMTVIRYSLIENRFTTLKVYDALGKIVSTLVNEKKSAGTFEIDFDGSNLASGVYYYKLSAGNFYQTKRMLLLK